LSSAQFQNDAILVSQPCGLYPAPDCNTATDGRIGPDNVRGSPQIVGAAHHVCARRTDGADANAADAQRIIPTPKMQDATAATDADDKPSTGGSNVD